MDLSKLSLPVVRRLKLNNDQIIELVSLFLSSDDYLLYTDQVRYLRSIYDNSVRSIDIEVFNPMRGDMYSLDTIRRYFEINTDVGVEVISQDAILAYQGQNNLIRIMQFVFKIFGEPDSDTLYSIKEFIQSDKSINGQGIPVLLSYLTSLEEKFAPYADTPEWIIPMVQDPDETKKAEELVNSLKNVGNITKGMTPETLFEIMNKASDQELPEELLEKFNEISLDDLHDLARKTVANFIALDIRKSKELFRLFGPTNTSDIEVDYTVIDVSNIYGGPRMFLDTRYEYDENGEPTDEWFTGRCQNAKCEFRIRKKVYAVREPIMAGGWRGCFCSFECLREHMSEPIVKHEGGEGTEEEDYLTEDDFDTLKSALEASEAYEELLNDIGIYDR